MQRGADGTALPGECVVIRMAVRPKDWPEGVGALAAAFKPDAGTLVTAFMLSSRDRAGDPPHLSVFEYSLTTLDQAYLLTGGNKPLALRLPVDGVRDLTSADGVTKHLDVQWLRALTEEDGDVVPSQEPGSEGHAGIVGLEEPSKPERKRYRVKLADLAISCGCVLVE